MELIIYIYSLTDPNTNVVRYIGKSVNPKRRFNEHINNCHKSSNNNKDNWIKKLLFNNQFPILNIIEETTIDKWSDREKYWITMYTNLTNSTSGGEYGIPTDDVIQKMRVNNTGDRNPMWGKRWTEEQRLKLSIQRMGVPKTDEWKDGETMYY
jgi:predicted GIY-YIG superfamily endonuclease